MIVSFFPPGGAEIAALRRDFFIDIVRHRIYGNAKHKVRHASLDVEAAIFKSSSELRLPLLLPFAFASILRSFRLTVQIQLP